MGGKSKKSKPSPGDDFTDIPLNDASKAANASKFEEDGWVEIVIVYVCNRYLVLFPKIVWCYLAVLMY